jgi:signal transduction histidine kinase
MLLPSVKSVVELLITCETRQKDWVLGDLLRIEQVIVNVITNAIKNTKEGSINLSIKWSTPDIIKFECIDTGPGIPLKDQELLFETLCTTRFGSGVRSRLDHFQKDCHSHGWNDQV